LAYACEIIRFALERTPGATTRARTGDRKVSRGTFFKTGGHKMIGVLEILGANEHRERCRIRSEELRQFERRQESNGSAPIELQIVAANGLPLDKIKIPATNWRRFEAHCAVQSKDPVQVFAEAIEKVLERLQTKEAL
jgi:hypothetical protein